MLLLIDESTNVATIERCNKCCVMCRSGHYYALCGLVGWEKVNLALTNRN